MIEQPKPTGEIDPQCKKFHEDTGMCLCLVVACVGCEKHHAPHKPCPKSREPAR